VSLVKYPAEEPNREQCTQHLLQARKYLARRYHDCPPRRRRSAAPAAASAGTSDALVDISTGAVPEDLSTAVECELGNYCPSGQSSMLRRVVLSKPGAAAGMRGGRDVLPRRIRVELGIMSRRFVLRHDGELGCVRSRDVRSHAGPWSTRHERVGRGALGPGEGGDGGESH